MGNHNHLLIETPQANLVAGMLWFQTTWSVRFNRFHRHNGHLFPRRYKAIVVDPEERGYLVRLSDYIHLNLVRAGLVGLADKLFSYRWSSYPWYAATAGRAGSRRGSPEKEKGSVRAYVQNSSRLRLADGA